jgi:hypothetical protein
MHCERCAPSEAFQYDWPDLKCSHLAVNVEWPEVARPEAKSTVFSFRPGFVEVGLPAFPDGPAKSTTTARHFFVRKS